MSSAKVRIYSPGEVVPSFQGTPALSTTLGYIVAGGGHVSGPHETYSEAVKAKRLLEEIVQQERE